MDTAELIKRLASAARAGTRTVNASVYKELSRDDAYDVQDGVREALGASVGMLKTAVHPDGIGVASPIYAGGVGAAPAMRHSASLALGVEVEVGVVLARDIASSADIPAAIDHYFTGVEVCGTRYVDRSLAGPTGSLADSQSALGYVIGPGRAAADDINGLDVVIEFAGKQIYAAPAKHGFGNVLASLRAYADRQHATLPLTKGSIITTGSMCGLVPTSGSGHLVARLGDQIVEFDLV
jgi:2-keto-4-pentenoate hydratase